MAAARRRPGADDARAVAAGRLAYSVRTKAPRVLLYRRWGAPENLAGADGGGCGQDLPGATSRPLRQQCRLSRVSANHPRQGARPHSRKGRRRRRSKTNQVDRRSGGSRWQDLRGMFGRRERWMREMWGEIIAYAGEAPKTQTAEEFEPFRQTQLDTARRLYGAHPHEIEALLFRATQSADIATFTLGCLLADCVARKRRASIS